MHPRLLGFSTTCSAWVALVLSRSLLMFAVLVLLMADAYRSESLGSRLFQQYQWRSKEGSRSEEESDGQIQFHAEE